MCISSFSLLFNSVGPGPKSVYTSAHRILAHFRNNVGTMVWLFILWSSSDSSCFFNISFLYAEAIACRMSFPRLSCFATLCNFFFFPSVLPIRHFMHQQLHCSAVLYNLCYCDRLLLFLSSALLSLLLAVSCIASDCPLEVSPVFIDLFLSKYQREGGCFLQGGKE